MPSTFTKKQMGAPILKDRSALIADVVEHLHETTPHVIKAYPPGYLLGIINESLNIAVDELCIDDVVYLRLFVDLRWRIAAGWFRQPAINAVLSDTTQSTEHRFATITGEAFDACWDEAEALDGPEEWRGHLYDGSMP